VKPDEEDEVERGMRKLYEAYAYEDHR